MAGGLTPDGLSHLVGDAVALGEEVEAGAELVGVGLVFAAIGAEPEVIVFEMGEVLAHHCLEGGGDA